MDIPSLIRFSSWFVPIPFMLLYHLKTTKLNWLSGLPYIAGLITIPILLFFPLGIDVLGFRMELISFYIGMLILSFYIFLQKYNLPQALSIAVCISFFASLFWELPYHVFTIIQRGYFDQAFPLHLLYAFPAVFIWGKIQLKKDKLNIFLVGLSMLISTIGMFFLLFIGGDIITGIANLNNINLWYIAEGTWFITRFVCFVSLYTIFYRGVLRHNPHCSPGVYERNDV